VEFEEGTPKINSGIKDDMFNNIDLQAF